MMAIRYSVIVTFVLMFFGKAYADVAMVAVASNFVAPAKAMKARFEAQSEHQVKLVFGSSGKLYAQILHGAPFQLFLSADQHKPDALVKARRAIASSRYDYAQGRIALWSASDDVVLESIKTLKENAFNKLAIANPKLAPYGVAALQVLNKHALYETLKPKLVMGENIAQTYQFVSTGNAELGFVAVSQITQGQTLIKGSMWLVPKTLHDPIFQSLVLMNNANSAAIAFADFIKTPTAKAIITQYGYDVETAL